MSKYCTHPWWLSIPAFPEPNRLTRIQFSAGCSYVWTVFIDIWVRACVRLHCACGRAVNVGFHVERVSFSSFRVLCVSSRESVKLSKYIAVGTRVYCWNRKRRRLPALHFLVLQGLKLAEIVSRFVIINMEGKTDRDGVSFLLIFFFYLGRGGITLPWLVERQNYHRHIGSAKILVPGWLSAQFLHLGSIFFIWNNKYTTTSSEFDF